MRHGRTVGVGGATCRCGVIEGVPAMNCLDFEVNLVNSTVPISAYLCPVLPERCFVVPLKL